ncbi:unnamed protein product, partial [Musa textilis]
MCNTCSLSSDSPYFPDVVNRRSSQDNALDYKIIENRIDGFELLIYFGVVVMCVGISMLAVNWFSFRLDYVQLSAHTSHQPLNQLDHLAIGKRLQAWQGEDGCGC